MDRTQRLNNNKDRVIFAQMLSVLLDYPLPRPLIRKKRLFLELFLSVPVGGYAGVFWDRRKAKR